VLKVEFQAISKVTDHLIYVVLVTHYKDQLVLVRHKERTTWEIPGGHIEAGETPDQGAARELVEETGAQKFSVRPITDYSVTRTGEGIGYGRLYYCDVSVLGPLGISEIGQVILVDRLPDNLTYKEIQPILLEKVMNSI